MSPSPNFRGMMNKRQIGCSALLALAAFLLSWQQVQATRLGYRVGRVRGEVSSRRAKVAYLRTDLERLNSPERLAREAAVRLSMAPAAPDVQIVLGEAGASPRPRPDRRPRYLSFLIRR